MQKVRCIVSKLDRLVFITMILVGIACIVIPFDSSAMRTFESAPSLTDQRVRGSSLNAATVTPTVLHFHGNPTDDGSCSGIGNADGALCGGPFLLPKATLGTLVAAHWNIPDPELNGATDQNIIDPNWIWNLSSPTTIGGDMTIHWWASCGACGQNPFSPADWTIRLWADGAKVFEQQVTNLTPLAKHAEPSRVG